MIRTGILRMTNYLLHSARNVKQFNKSLNFSWLSYVGALGLKRRPRNFILTLPVLYQIGFFKKASPPEDKLTKDLKLADQHYDDMNYDEAATVLKTLINEGFDNDDVYWRLARIEYELGKAAGKDEKAHLLQEAQMHLVKALDANPKNGYAHKWMAILLDSQSSGKGIRERIGLAIQVRDHLLEALLYIPNDGTTHYILGVWYYTIAEFTWYERQIAQTLNSKFPTTTYEQALDCFQRAEVVEPDFYSRNYLFLGKCYLNLKDNEKATEFLVKARDYPQKTDEDKSTHQEAVKLLEKLGIPLK